MPIYEYRCNACGIVFEEFIRSASPQGILCQVCGCEKVERAISIFGFSSKGSAGETTKVSGGGSGCSSCSSHHCSHCH